MHVPVDTSLQRSAQTITISGVRMSVRTFNSWHDEVAPHQPGPCSAGTYSQLLAEVASHCAMDMCLDICVAMRVDMCTDMCIASHCASTCAQECVWRFYGHVYGCVCRHVSALRCDILTTPHVPRNLKN